MQRQRTYYEILELDELTATASEIRKSYLKLSLKHHPDKNPNATEEAKAKFIEIGAAYETLSDPVKRRIYDQQLRSGRRQSSPTEEYGGSSGGFDFDSQNFTEQCYNSYRDAFDATVAGMSEEELAAAVGAVTVVASVVGSMIGSRLLSGGGRNGAAAARGGGATGSVLGVAGSMIGSVVASELASSGVRALHQESVQRIAYKEECQCAVERGEPVPDPPRTSGLGDVFQRTVDSVKNATQSSNAGGNNTNQRSKGLGNMWRMAAEGVRAAATNNNTRATNTS